MSDNLEFFRANHRPDVVVTGSFAPTVENIGVMRRVWKAAFMGIEPGAVMLPKDTSITVLPAVVRLDCRYCRTPRQRDHSTCSTCGAPYPA